MAASGPLALQILEENLKLGGTPVLRSRCLTLDDEGEGFEA